MSVPTGRRVLTGWGRTSPTAATVIQPADAAEASAALGAAGPRGAIARGLGRAYGDAAQNGGGTVIECTRLDGIGTISQEGTVTVDGGASLDALIAAAIAEGWFVPVTPGTRHVTVGGAIAADVHGKNHHVEGSFGRHVTSITLLLPGGEVRTLTPQGDAALFWATCGGMGLTGIVQQATVRLTPAPTRYMLVDTERTADLDDTMRAMEEGDARYRYTVAWVDLVTRGRALGRSVLTRGEHAPLDALAAKQRASAREYGPGRTVPVLFGAPPRAINRASVRAFNALWFRKAPAERRGEVQPLEAFFYPLDGLQGWNRAYGAAGFLQWQCVLPFGEEARLVRIIEALATGPAPVTLAVLKRFGAASPGPLSFPLPGWTLAADLPATRGNGLDAFLDGLDLEVADGGGRLYLAKDSRMRADLLPVMYPRLEEWREVQASADPAGVLTSDLDRRLGITVRASARLRSRVGGD